MTKKEIKKNIKHTKEIERMLLQFLADPGLPDEQAHMVVGELLTAADYIVRFENCLRELETTNIDKYKKGEK